MLILINNFQDEAEGDDGANDVDDNVEGNGVRIENEDEDHEDY